jgi:hypothetical protein
LKRVHWLTQRQCPYCSSRHYECKDTLKLNIGVAWASPPIMWIHIQATLRTQNTVIPDPPDNKGWEDHCHVCHWSGMSIPGLDLWDVEKLYH